MLDYQNFKKYVKNKCSCGGNLSYFGEALMGSLTCDSCKEYLMVVGWDGIKTIYERYQNGERGFVKTL